MSDLTRKVAEATNSATGDVVFGVVQVFRGLFWKMGPKLVKTGYDKHTPTVTTERT